MTEPLDPEIKALRAVGRAFEPLTTAQKLRCLAFFSDHVLGTCGSRAAEELYRYSRLYRDLEPEKKEG